jgi:hypothetical protein
MQTDVRVRTIDAHRFEYWLLTDEQRREIGRLVKDHGFDPNDVRSITYDVIDAPLLRIREYLTDDGRRYVDPATADAAVEDHEVALRSPLPAWWNPDSWPDAVGH